MRTWMNWFVSGWRGVVLIVLVMMVGAFASGAWMFYTPGLSAKSDVTGKVTPLGPAAERTAELVEQAYESGVEKSGTEVVPQHEVLAFMLKKVNPKNLGPKQRAVIEKKIAHLRAGT